jgi:D-alanyl-D-alanine carboxypeptidase
MQPQQEIVPLVNRSDVDVSRMRLPSAGELYGLEDTHVSPVDADWSLGEIRLHPAAARAFERLRFDGAQAGFDLRIASGFRSFARQLIIWNEKAAGLRRVLDDRECIVDINSLSERERVFAILRWSALPGASRHHWGSDMDIYDARVLPTGVAPDLTVAEAVDRGVFAALHRWLDARIDADAAHGFFRPYTGSGLGIAREPWHLSFAPLAAECQRRFDMSGLMAILQAHGLALQAHVRECSQEIERDYIAVPARLYPNAWAHRLNRRDDDDTDPVSSNGDRYT